MKTGAMLIAVAGLAAAANAQTQGTATWIWEVSNSISPENPSATVTLRVDMTPDTNDVNDPNGKLDGNGVQGFGAAIWDTIGDPTASITGWTIHSGLTFLLGDTTSSDGVSLFGSQAGQIPGFGPNDDSDPIFVMDFTVTTADFSPRTLVYSTQTDGQIAIWTSGDPDGTPWTTVEANIGIEVVPAPASAALLGLGGLLVGRRRR